MNRGLRKCATLSLSILNNNLCGSRGCDADTTDKDQHCCQKHTSGTEPRTVCGKSVSLVYVSEGSLLHSNRTTVRRLYDTAELSCGRAPLRIEGPALPGSSSSGTASRNRQSRLLPLCSFYTLGLVGHRASNTSCSLASYKSVQLLLVTMCSIHRTRFR